MSDWREDAEAFHALQLLQQEREEWLRDQQAQDEYQQYLNQLKQEGLKNEMEG